MLARPGSSMKVAALVDRADDALAALCLASCTVVVLFAVVARYVFNASFLWTDEAARYLVIWAAYFGATAAVRTKEHVRMELALGWLPARARRVVDVLVDLACAVFSGALAVAGFRYASESMRFGLVSTESDLAVPLWVVHAIIPLAFSVMTVRLVMSAVAPLTRPTGARSSRASVPPA